MGFIGNNGGDDRNAPRGILKTADDTDRNFTSTGNIALTVTNFGTIGDRNAYWPDQPSCEYPRGSRIEHIYQGGLWVGAASRRTGQTHVTTGATDQASSSRTGKDYEFTSDAGSGMVQRSSLSSSQYFAENAISHQDFVAYFTDLHKTNPTTGDTIPGHEPLGITVRQESYAWNFPFADFFVILNYTIYNTTSDTLDSVYVGFWNNAVVRNTNNVHPGTTGYFNYGANGYSDTLRMMYTFDYSGLPAPPPANSYVGVKLLGATPFPHGVDSVGNLTKRAYFNAWTFRSQGAANANYFSPLDDNLNVGGARSRYDRLAASLPQPSIDVLRSQAGNYTTLLSTGPFSSMLPGDSLNVVFGVVCAKKNGTLPASLDSRDQRATLYSNASFCQKAYQGEDVNGNGVLDPGEDLNGNGRLDHYQLPQPPRPPKVRVEVGNQSVSVYWDKSTSELSVDPVTGETDFEGYRVYRSTPGADFTNPQDLLLDLTLVGDFDVTGDGIGHDTGFDPVLLPGAKYFPGDTVGYWYRFPPAGAGMTHLNGWQYIYGVAAYDRGDSVTGVTPLQSKTELARVVPGTPAQAGAHGVGVYPNPYYGGAVWDGPGERNRKIYFYNLPSRCEIRIYTLAGDIVADIQHDAATYDGSDIGWFRQFSGTQLPPRFSGGEHAWDLITKYDQAIATGLYLYTVRDAQSGETVKGKFLVIK